jgi:hypothetical protein
MKKKAKIYYIAVLAVFVIAGMFGINAISAEKIQVSEIDYSLSIPVRNIVMTANETVVIPVGVSYPQEKSLHIKTGVTVPHNESFFIDTGKDNLPVGISAVLDKRTVDLPALATKGDAIRDTFNLKISVSQNAQPGKHTIAVVVYEDNGQSYSRYINVEVQK